MAVTYEQVRKAALALPGVEDSTSWGNRSLKVKGKLLAVLKEDGETLVLRVPLPDKDFLLAADPELFWTTAHYDGYAAVLVRLQRLKKGELGELVQRSHAFVTRPKERQRAKKR